VAARVHHHPTAIATMHQTRSTLSEATREDVASAPNDAQASRASASTTTTTAPGIASRESTAARSVVGYATRRRTAPTGIAANASGTASGASRPKCRRPTGVVVHQTATFVARSPRSDGTTASRSRSGAGGTGPYQRWWSGGAHHRSPATARNVRWYPGRRTFVGSARRIAVDAMPRSASPRHRRPARPASAKPIAASVARATDAWPSTIEA
jgi:hypothetical protein